MLILLIIITFTFTASASPSPAPALRAADSVSRAQGVSAEVRAHNLRLLGDYQFVQKNYERAANFYRQAMEIDSTSGTYKELYARALALQLGQPAPAAARPTAAATAQPTPTPATAPTAPTATRPAATTPPPAPAQQQPVPIATPTVAQGPAFTVQVGAFGTEANANNLVARLSGTHSDITISQGTGSSGQPLFRVRIGTFGSREEAAAFRDKLITEAGLSAQVVEK